MLSPADVAVLSGNAGSNRNNDGFGFDNGAWWIIILLLFGWGRNGFGNGGGFGGNDGGNCCYGFGAPNIYGKLDGITYGISDATFALNNNSLKTKKYTCEDILNKYAVDWKYYDQFKENIQLMLNENYECSITLILFNNFKDLQKIFKKFKNDEVEKIAITHFNLTKELDSGIAYTYNDKFDLCLLINC